MTNMPEAKLAREAELCYATVAMVTDYDSWHPEHGEVDIQSILAVAARQCRQGAPAGRRRGAAIGGPPGALPVGLRPGAGISRC